MIKRAFFLFLLAPVAFADGDCKGHSCNDGGPVTVDTRVDVGLQADTSNVISSSNSQGNINAGGDRYDSLGIGLAAPGFGDVAIGNCMISIQTNYVSLYGKQRFRYAWLCVANMLDAAGKHEQAARLRCEKIKDLRDTFGDACVDVWTLTVPAPQAVVEEPEDHADEHEEHEQMLVEYRALAERVETLQDQVRGNRIDPAIVQRIQRIEAAKARTRAILEEAKQ